MFSPATQRVAHPDRTRATWSTPALIVGLSVFGFALVVALFAASYGVKLAHLVRDPAAIYDYPSYIGFFSHIGVALLVSTASLTAFAAWTSCSLKRKNIKTLAAAAALSAILAIDDIFMFHEKASRIGEVTIFAVYGLLGFGLWCALRIQSDRYDLRGFNAAILFLGVSVIADIFKIYGPFAFWLEDFSKLSGFAAWLTFWAGFANHTLRKS